MSQEPTQPAKKEDAKSKLVSQSKPPQQQQQMLTSRRNFVRKIARKAAYATPVVIALAANQNAMGASGVSGGS